jgi:hypothetical protein
MSNDGHGLDRRRFLRAGGLGAGLLAVAAACVNQHEAEQIIQTGTRVPAPSTAVPPNPGTPKLDAEMVLTALSVEKLAIDTYNEVLAKNWVTDANAVPVIRKVLENHKAHSTELAIQASALGQNPDAVPANATVDEETVTSELEAVAEAPSPRERQIAALKSLTSLELALAQFYAGAAGTMTTGDLRRRIGSIGAATARQYSAMAGPAGDPLVPMAFMPTAPAAIPEEARVPVDEATLRPPGTTPGR